MELNRELYQRTFSKLKAPEKIGKEILAMTEKTRKPKKFILRRLAVAAAVMALAVALAMGANAATDGKLVIEVLNFVESFPFGGGKIDLYEGKIDDEPVYFCVDEQESISGAGTITVEVDDSGNDGKTHYSVTEYDGESSRVVESGEMEDFTAEKSPETEVPSAPEE